MMVGTERELEVEDERDDAVIGKALRISAIAFAAIVAVAVSIVAWQYLQRPAAVVTAPVAVSLPQVREAVQRPIPSLPFADITESAGIDFRHNNGAVGEKLLPETMGGGCAFFDYDGDQHPDILLVNSKSWSHADDASQANSEASTLKLYRNDGTGRFRDVTAAAGLDVSLYGQGCAVADFDNDGDVDLFVSAVSERNTALDEPPPGQLPGPNRLFRNDGGRFVDVTAMAGVSGVFGDWGSSCGWFDYDRDSDLDLWVCNYVDWSREFDLAQNFRLTGGDRAYGRPQAFGGSYPHLYRNDGGGKFTEVSDKAKIRVNAATTGTPLAKSLGVTFFDFDHDGNLDVLVANDTVQNNLFRNLGDGTFQEMAALCGVAFDAEGNARGAMGIDVGCTRDDPRCACVAIGNFANEMTAFYVSAPNSLVFSDQAIANGLGPSTRLMLTFGVFFFDADLDGWEDLFHANGHLEEDIAKVQASQTYEQSPQLFWNAGPDAATEFVPVPTESTGPAFAAPMVGRGAAYADIDGDGDLDVLIATAGRKPRLLRNDQQLKQHWLRLKLVGNGTTVNRDAIGARVELTTRSGRVIHKQVMPTKSYLSQCELPLTIGLGTDEVEMLQVRWPDNTQQTVTIDAVDRNVVINQPESP